jgi:hypothetical protein
MIIYRLKISTRRRKYLKIWPLAYSFILALYYLQNTHSILEDTIKSTSDINRMALIRNKTALCLLLEIYAHEHLTNECSGHTISPVIITVQTEYIRWRNYCV